MFQNVYPTEMLAEGASYPKMIRQFLFGKQANQEPAHTLPSVREDLKKLNREEPCIVWFGHSSYLLALHGNLILVDPVFNRASPFQFLGTKPFATSQPYSLADIPDPDLVILTHDHYDHLDYAVIQELAPRVKVFATSLGVGAHLEHWGVDAAKITEFDWWESREIIPGVELTAAPARHFSGRGFTRFKTLWSSFILKSGGLKIFVGGDSGYDGSFKKIGAYAGGFDFALLECGQYDAQWPNIHMMPEQTVQAGIDLRAKVMMAVHWGKFKLANHPWTDPIERAFAAATMAKVAIATPAIGERMRIDAPVLNKPWWR